MSSLYSYLSAEGRPHPNLDDFYNCNYQTSLSAPNLDLYPPTIITYHVAANVSASFEDVKAVILEMLPEMVDDIVVDEIANLAMSKMKDNIKSIVQEAIDETIKPEEENNS